MYESSPTPEPTPAPFATTTVCPRLASACTPPGTRPTRYSRTLISLGQPMIIESSAVSGCWKGPRTIARRGCRSSRVVSHRSARLLFADEAGRVYEHPELLALVRDGTGAALPAEVPNALPQHAHLAMLPGRRPLGLDPRTGAIVELREMKLGRRTERTSAVGAVLPPGWTRLALPAYQTSRLAPVLPQWAYTAAAWDARLGHVAYALHTDLRRHWDPATHSTPELAGLVQERLRRDDNPLLQQLARCALEWRCFTAQNTFYARDEGAIPASVGCNARCVGCISGQPPEGPPSPHEPVEQAPAAARMAATGMAHLRAAPGRTRLTFPGVTDQEGEADALCELLGSCRVDQVQVRSLAIDPEQYMAVAERTSAGGPAQGMRTLLRRLRRARKGLVIGNFARGLAERA